MFKKKEIIILLIVGFLTRIIISPLYISFPYIPHDFYAYVGLGKCMSEGKYLQFGCVDWGGRQGETSAYGPFFASLMWIWYSLFGEYDFFAYKLLSVTFDVLNIILVYLIAKKIFGKKAFYLGLLYALSFIVLFNSAVLGNDDNIAMFFVLMSLNFLIERKLPESAIFLSISILFKIIGIITIPAILYYIYRKYNLTKLFTYVLMSSITFLILLSPFIYLAGIEKSFFYIIGSSHTTKQIGAVMSFYNIFRLITNRNISFLILPTLIIGYVMTIILFFLKRMDNKEIELFRNMALLWIVSLLLGGILAAPQQYLIFVFILFVFGCNLREKINIKQTIYGIILIVISLIIYSVIYRWGLVEYSDIDRVLLLSSVIIAPLGTFLFLNKVKMNFRVIWSLVILAVIIFSEVHASPLLVLPLERLGTLFNVKQFTVIENLYGDHILGSSNHFFSYGVFYMLPALILWFCLIYLYIKLGGLESEKIV